MYHKEHEATVISDVESFRFTVIGNEVIPFAVDISWITEVVTVFCSSLKTATVTRVASLLAYELDYW